jgi:putative thioredoxin
MTQMPPLPNLRGAVDLSSLVKKQPRPAAPASPTSSASSSRVPATTSSPAAQSGSVAEIPVPHLLLDATDETFNAVLDLSSQVPVIVDIWAEWCAPCKQLSPVLEKLIVEFGGRLVLVKVDADKNPQLVQAFTAQSIPTVAAVIAGRPLELFSGVVAEADIRDLFEQVLEIASQNGITSIAVPAQAPSGNETEPEPAPVPPLHQEAFDAAERGDYEVAIAAFSKALAQNPADADAKAGLAQISLLARLQGKTLATVRERAASNPGDVEAQLDVVDLDISGGHVDDAFDRLLTLFPSLDAAGKNSVRERMLELFEVVGLDSPSVTQARKRLTNLLYS